MNTNIKYALAFAAGFVIGSAVTWKALKNKYEQIAQDEIDFQLERFSRNKKELTEELKDANDIISSYEKVEKAQVEEYKKTVAERGYTDYSSYSKPITEEKEKETAPEVKPYIIKPEDFGENLGYQCITLTYYAGDGILADDDDYLVDDVDNVVGVDSLSHFGDFEDDAVHVRNDRLKIDYEILRDKRKYKDVIGVNSLKAED